MNIPLALDFHTHLRQGNLLEFATSRLVDGGVQLALVMPNTQPPITSAQMAVDYRQELMKVEPCVLYLMTLYLTPFLTVEELEKAHAVGVAGVKYYPHGLTTNSEHGLDASSGFQSVYHLLAKMQELGLVLNIHGEVASSHEMDICVMNAEIHFLQHLRELHKDFPSLKIVLEHVTTREAVELVKELGESVACTVTVHHLELIVDDWAGRPHNYCKPVAKYPHDRSALREMVKSGHPRCFLGSDSAPHLKHRKEAAECCAGVYTGSHLLPTLAHILNSFGALDRLEDFTFSNGSRFYHDPILRAIKAQKHDLIACGKSETELLFDGKKGKRCALLKKDLRIPQEIHLIFDNEKSAVVPFMGGKIIDFSLEL